LKKEQAVATNIVISGVNTEVLMTSYVEDNTSQGKDWIFDSDSIVHVYSHKEMFNSLAANEEGAVKMVEGSTCEVISTGTINVTCRDGMMRALEMIRYVLEARYNLISIEVLDEEGCRIQVQQGVITVNQGDR